MSETPVAAAAEGREVSGRQGRSSGRADSDDDDDGGCRHRKQFCIEYCWAKRTRESRKLPEA